MAISKAADGRTMRGILALIAIGLASVAVAVTWPRPGDAALEGPGAEACAGYAARAAAPGAAERDPFSVIVAGACARAGIALARGSALERRRAETLVARVAALHQTISVLNAERLRAVAADPRAVPLRLVSRTGEFLIAHRLGLVAALEDWPGAGAGLWEGPEEGDRGPVAGGAGRG